MIELKSNKYNRLFLTFPSIPSSASVLLLPQVVSAPILLLSDIGPLHLLVQESLVLSEDSSAAVRGLKNIFWNFKKIGKKSLACPQ